MVGSSPSASGSNPFALLDTDDGWVDADETEDQGPPSSPPSTRAPAPKGNKAAPAASEKKAGKWPGWGSTQAAPAHTISSDKAPHAPAAATSVWLKNPLVWIDLEMTGLRIEQDTILEVACLVTDGDLTTTIEGPSLAIHHDEAVLLTMNDWCVEHHGRSGLTQRVRNSSVDMRAAELRVLEFVKEHVPIPGSAQLAGSTIHMDRMFLNRWMPELLEHLNYRVVDVSSVRELAKRWYPTDYKRQPQKASSHSALADIRESLAELKYYRSAIFKPAPPTLEASAPTTSSSSASSYRSMASMLGGGKGGKKR